MEERNPEQERKVNRFELEIGLEDQPDLFGYWADLHSASSTEKNDLKRELDDLRSEIELKVREAPGKYVADSIKITESVISSTVQIQKEYKELNKKYIDALNETNRLAGIKETFDHRRSSLKSLVELWTNEYYGQKVGEAKSRGDHARLGNKSSSDQREQIADNMEKRVRRSRG